MDNSRLAFGAFVLGILIIALVFARPSVTGFVPTETVSQSVDLYFTSSERVSLSSDEQISLRGLSISGQVEGSGLVNVYLVKTDGDKLLVASNKHSRKHAMREITGMPVLIVSKRQQIDLIETTDDPTGPVAFINDCVETCSLNPEFFKSKDFIFEVVVEPGTSLHLSRLRYVVAQ